MLRFKDGGGEREKTVCFYFMWCVCNWRQGEGEEEARMDGGTQQGVGLKVKHFRREKAGAGHECSD